MINRKKRPIEEPKKEKIQTANQTLRNKFGLPNIVIPAEVLFHSQLSSTEKILFGVINNLSATEDGCWASNKYLANFLNLKSQTISNAVSTLKNLGFLEVIITQRPDGIQVRRIFIDKDYLRKYEGMLIEAYKKINKDIILKKSKTPIKKIKDPYNNSLNKIDNKIGNKIDNSLINKTYVFSKHEEQIISIINFWNNLPNSVTHSNPETKTYKTIFLQIENLFCGLPLIRKKDNSPTKPFLEFLSSNHIPSSLQTKYWRENGIKNILQTIHDDIPEGEKISLNQSLWNAFAKRRGGGFSLFLYTAAQIDIPQKYIQLATKLATSINDTRMTTSNKKQWAQEFQQFIEKDNISINEINGLIEWYGKNRGGKYIPVVDSPEELREKYSRLKLAMARSNPQPQQSDVKLSSTGFPLIDHAYPKINVLSKDRRSQIPKITLEDWQELLEGHTKQLLNADIWSPNYRPRKVAVFNGVVSMQEWLEKVDYSVDGGANLRLKIRPLNELIAHYILCINDWWGGWMDGVKDNVFDVNNKIFKMFIREMETSFSVRMHINSEGWINDSDWEPRDG